MKDQIDNIAALEAIAQPTQPTTEGTETGIVAPPLTNNDLFEDDEAEITETYDPEPEQVFTTHKTGLSDPRIKPISMFVGSGLLASLILFMFTNGCQHQEPQAVVAKATDTDKQIGGLQQSLITAQAQLEKLTRENENLKAIAAGDKAGKTTGNKKKPSSGQIQQTAIAPQPDYNSRSYAPVAFRPSAIPQGQAKSTPVPLPRISASTGRVQEPRRDFAAEREATYLKEQIAKLKSEQKVQESQQQEVVPQAENVANIEDEPVTEIPGGIEEQAILSNAAISSVAVGSEARAVLDTPIVGNGTVMITLKDNVTDNAGKVCLAKGTKLMGVASISGGIAQVQLSTAIIGGQQTSIPAQSVSVFRGDRSPLLAKKLNGGNGAGKVILSALLQGGGSMAGQLLQPRTTNQISNSNGISSFSENSSSTLGNALIAGGGSIAQSLGNGLQQNLQRSDGSAQVMGVKAGTELLLVFSGPVQLLTASADIPETIVQPEVQPVVSEAEEQAIINEPLIEPDAGQLIEPSENDFIGG